MDLAEITKALGDRSASVRLGAARAARDRNDRVLLETLREVRMAESDSWVKNALDAAILRTISATTQPIPVVVDSDTWDPARTADELYAQALQTVTETVVHEGRPIMGDIRQAAEAEITDYPSSQTARFVRRLEEFFDVLMVLHTVSQAPQTVEFDLADLIADLCSSATTDDGVAVLATRLDPAITMGDPRLVRHALSNLIKNAVEASPPNGIVIVNCAVTDTDTWAAVLDDGPGLPVDIAAVFEPGRSSKSRDEHFGLGLTIARQAMTSMGGQVHLGPRDIVGARAEVRWSHLESPA